MMTFIVFFPQLTLMWREPVMLLTEHSPDIPHTHMHSTLFLYMCYLSPFLVALLPYLFKSAGTTEVVKQLCSPGIHPARHHLYQRTTADLRHWRIFHQRTHHNRSSESDLHISRLCMPLLIYACVVNCNYVCMCTSKFISVEFFFTNK